MKPTNKSTSIGPIRFDANEEKQVKEAAKREGMKLGPFIRRGAIQLARKVLGLK